MVGEVAGDMDTPERLLQVNNFRGGIHQVLVTTNLLARGMNFPDVSLVLNFDIPTNENREIDTKSYLHRIGRTGRFGN